LLYYNAALHSFDRAIEDCDEAVAGGLDKFSVVFADARLNEITLDPHHASVRSLFIDLH
jgi:hypothetical protein